MNNKELCRICKGNTRFIFKANILGKYNVKYFHCPTCGYIQTEKPYWLKEAYSEAISAQDTGIIQRNIRLANITAGFISLFFNKKAKFLDYAGGYGIFVRLMRDMGFDFYWYDKYSPNLFAKGFEWKENMSNFELITCIEALEHFENPIYEIERMLKLSHNILFTTELYDDINSPPKPEEWWYYAFNTGQHIGFFNIKTLKYVADRYSLNLYSNGKTIHMFTNKKHLVLSNKFLFKAIIKIFSIFGRGITNLILRI